MENTENERLQTSEGAVPKSRAQDEHPEVKEGNPAQQRPEHGSDAGPNTSTRDQQLPTLNNPSQTTGEEE